jgi:hypothetical protein
MGNWLLIKSQFYPVAVSWWMGFLLLTIVAERLELSRFLKITTLQNNLLLAALSVAFAGLLFHFIYMEAMCLLRVNSNCRMAI